MQHIEHISFEDKFSHWLANGMSLERSEDLILNNIRDYKESLDLNNLLIASTFTGTDKMITTLVELGANLESKSEQNSTPIMFVAQQDNLPMFKYLLEKGANMYERNSYGHDAEYFAKGNVLNYIMTNQLSVNIIEMKTLKSKNKELEDKLQPIYFATGNETSDGIVNYIEMLKNQSININEMETLKSEKKKLEFKNKELEDRLNKAEALISKLNIEKLSVKNTNNRLKRRKIEI